MKQFMNFALIALLGAIFFCYCIEGQKVPVTNYAASLQLAYNNDSWKCDTLRCPQGTFGCRILRENDINDPTMLLRTNICYDKNNSSTMSTVQTMVMPVVFQVYINITSYMNAQSRFTTGSSGDSQYASGVVNVADWDIFQNSYINSISRNAP